MTRLQIIQGFALAGDSFEGKLIVTAINQGTQTFAHVFGYKEWHILVYD